MFELSVARKYLTPRWRQLSVSIISLISILVIALVVWLIVVFFSVTRGLEKSWISKLIALTAPVRVLPTDKYYHSYFYKIDTLSSSSDYSLKSIGEKLASPKTDPYNPQIDAEIPPNWPKPDLDRNGELKDPVKIAFQEIESLNVPGLHARDFEMTATNLKLQLLRKSPFPSQYNQANLSQASYIGSFDQENQSLAKTLLPMTLEDLSNVLEMMSVSPENGQEDNPENVADVPQKVFQNKIKALLDLVEIEQLKTPAEGWHLPKTLFPLNGIFKVQVLYKKDKMVRVFIPANLKNKFEAQTYQVFLGTLEFKESQPFLTLDKETSTLLPSRIPLFLPGEIAIDAHLNKSNLDSITRSSDLLFDLQFTLQGIPLQGKAPLGSLKIEKAVIKSEFSENPVNSPTWLYRLNHQLILPHDDSLGDGILLPRGFRETGVLVGDRGYLSYAVPTASSLQEQRARIFIAGFYDPGIMPLGGKYLLVSKNLANLIRSTQGGEENAYSNGINIHFNDLSQVDQIKKELFKAFEEAGIAPYWRIETYREYDFTKDLIQQLRSEKNLFTLLATIIIIVACSNIISMLIILVNDKKLEIGILRSMGATSQSIAAIFGICGVVMGFVGSLVGILAAIFTLRHLQTLINFISRVQGYEMFNSHFYGTTLPSELSLETLGYVILATAFISLIAGLVPAIKASLMRPSAILRAE